MTLDKFPDAEPSITLDFTKSKKLDPRISFSRASSAVTGAPSGSIPTGEGSGSVNGLAYKFQENVPRLSDKGLLIESQRTNFALANTSGADAGFKVGGVESFDVKPPDGSNNSVRRIGGYTEVEISASWTTGKRWHTGFVKPGNWGKIGFRFTKGGYDYFFFDLDASPPKVWRKLKANGQVFEQPPPPDTYILEEYSDGWWRIGFGAGSTGYNAYYLWDYDSEGNPNENNGSPGGQPAGSYAYVWGSQLEEGVFPTSFIPNTSTSASVTRAADVCEITGTDFSSWYNQNTGTWIGAINTAVPTTARLLEVGVPNYSISIRPGPTSTSIARNSSGADSVATTYPAKFGATNNVSQIRLWVNGTAGTAVTTGDQLTNSTQFSIGQTVSDTSQANAPIANISFYPTVLPDDAVQALTTQQT